MVDKKNCIIGDFIVYIIQKLNMVSEDGIMNRFNGVNINHIHIYSKKYYGTYIKSVINICVWTVIGNRETNIVETIHPCIIN